MKWVLLLGLVVGLAYGRTVFDYERDGLENKQEGFPGKSVSGQYEWRAPNGKVTEISYVADHLGFRLVDDPEIQEPSEPSEPSSPSESTSQTNTKEAKAVIVGGGGEEEEEEEGEEEGEEFEGEEREAEEQEGEEEEEEESGKEKTEGETSESVIAAKTAEADATETEKADTTEAKTKTEETETNEDENTGKSLSQSPEKATEETDKAEDTERSGPVAADSVVPTEAVETPALVPVKVESTFAEKPINVKPSIVAETPVIAVAESSPAVEPMVVPVQGDTSFSTFDTPVSSDVVVVGVSYDGLENSPVAVPIAKELSLDPATSPAVEIQPVQEPIVSFPLAEPLQQPAVEVTPVLSENPLSVSVSVNRDIETPDARIIAVEPPTLPSQSSFFFSEIPQTAPLVEVQGASSGLSPVPVNVAPQQFQIFELVPQAPVPSSDQLIPSALPQIQVFQLDSSFTPVARTLETDPIAEENPSAAFVSEVSGADFTLGSGSSVDNTNIESYPVAEIEVPQHRFQVAKSGRSMDSAPVQVVKELDPFMDLYFIPESFKMSEPKPSQSSVHFVEVEAPAPPQEMIIKAKSFSQPNEIENLGISAASSNNLDKPVLVLTAPAANSGNIFPDYSVDYIQPMTSEADFFQAPDSISAPVQYVQVPVTVFGNQEAVASPRIAAVDTESVSADDLTILSASPDASASSTSPAREVTLVALDEKPKEISEDVVLFDASAPLAKKRSSSQVPPLLPPLMKMSRILNTGF